MEVTENKMKFNKSWALSLVLTALLCTALTYALVQVYPYVHHDPRASVNVFVITETAAGRNELAAGNVITDLFETALRNAFAFNNDSVPNATNMTKYISTGNCTPAAALTLVTTECDNSSAFGRALGTVAAWQNGTDAAFNVTKTFTANATVTINSAGLNWYSVQQSDNNLVAVAAITETAFAVGDNCTIKGYD